MFSHSLLMAILGGAAVLLLLESIRWLVEKALLRRWHQESEFEAFFWGPLVINLIFMVMLPAIIYASLYPILPFSGQHSGIFIGLFVFAVGALPIQVRYYNQFKPATSMVAFQLLWTLLTLMAVLGTITYIYHF